MTSEELSSKTETGMSGSGDQKQKHVAVVGGGLVRYCQLQSIDLSFLVELPRGECFKVMQMNEDWQILNNCKECDAMEHTVLEESAVFFFCFFF